MSNQAKTTVSDEDLCPFCNGASIMLKDHTVMGFYVACTVCSACTLTMPTKQEAAALWNRRATADVTEVAAQRIFELFCGRPVDWTTHAVDDADDNIFRSADWRQAMAYANAALNAKLSQETGNG